MRGWCAALVAAAFLVAGSGDVAGPLQAGTGADERRPAAPAARKTVDYDAPNERWREGPVRYLLGKDEDDAFRALKTDEARSEFIRTFWASRDPIASTPENEYRALFYSRVAEASRIFTDSTKPGWKTDRGKIYILLGPPDDFEQKQFRDEFVPDAITWTYRNRGAAGIDSMPIVRFVKDQTGEYRLSNNLVLSGFENPFSIAFQMQAMQMKSLPEQTKVLDTIVSARALFDTSPFRTHRDFFRSTDGNTFAVLTLGVRPDLLLEGRREKPAGEPGAAAAAGAADSGVAAAGDRFEVVARLVGGRPDLPTYDFAGPSELRAGEESASSDAAGYRLFQGGQTVRAGPYTAFYGVVDRSTGEVFSFKEQVEVPDFHDDRFRLSGITLASRLERVDRPAAGYSTPFVLGSLKVIPRPDDVFHNGEDFAFYYQIYGPENDPIDGRPDLDLEYQFFSARDTGPGGLVFAPLGKPIRLTRQRSQVQGYTVPIKDWQRGTYRLKVQVTDNVGDRQSIEEVSFRVL
ncbi:MAG TPA: GWxTD domain-containing protein [Candidatus Polarisedimenticolia bacterium]|jgi:GWxTD domain-containing protein|nr:GWxTD domain-containing protein [Candidatus Polarisedimenticolia bacterium]